MKFISLDDLDDIVFLLAAIMYIIGNIAKSEFMLLSAIGLIVIVFLPRIATRGK